MAKVGMIAHVDHGKTALTAAVVRALSDVQRPVVAPQQPRAAPQANPADVFRNMFAILHNLGLAELNRAQVITDGNPLNNKQWDRFNNDLTTFVLKLDDARLDALYALVQARQPERYKEGRA